MAITKPRIDGLTIAGLALLLMPLLTMLHEIGGHAAMCAAVGRVQQIGAFYVECDTQTLLSKRLVSLAGPGIDAVLAVIGYGLWRNLKGDLARLVTWYVWLSCGFVASGYLLFSGVSGLGDLGPSGDGGLAPLAPPLVWRAAFVLVGFASYFMLVKAGMATLSAMIGQGPDTKQARRRIAHFYYAVLCIAAVVASLPNPVGLLITLTSAVAASFGGHAGLISIGYATHDGGEARAFTIGRNFPLLIAGGIATIAFAAILGPTLTFP